jgi:hypothetical protein
MVFDQLKKSFDDAVKRTKDAVNSVEDATEGKDEDQLESEYEAKMNRLEREYTQQVTQAITQYLDNQDYQKAEEIARKEGIGNQGYRKILNQYMEVRQLKAKRDLAAIRDQQLMKCEEFLRMADNADTLSGLKSNLNEAVQFYKKIEKGELIEIQRNISRSENVIKYYRDKTETDLREETIEMHEDVQKADEDIQQAEQDIIRLNNKLES